MSNSDRVMELIFDAIDEINNQLSTEEQLPKTAESPLFGSSSKLDSIGLVNLIVSIEQRLEEELDLQLTLADEKAMSQKNSPFRTVSTLVEYIIHLIDENYE